MIQLINPTPIHYDNGEVEIALKPEELRFNQLATALNEQEEKFEKLIKFIEVLSPSVREFLRKKG